MKLTEEQAQVMADDIQPVIDDLTRVYGEETTLKALFAFISIKVINRLGKKAYADLLLLGIEWIGWPTLRGSK